MKQLLHLLDTMRDNILRIEYAVKKDDLETADFDEARDLMNQQGELLADLRSELAMTEDSWRNSL